MSSSKFFYKIRFGFSQKPFIPVESTTFLTSSALRNCADGRWSHSSAGQPSAWSTMGSAWIRVSTVGIGIPSLFCPDWSKSQGWYSPDWPSIDWAGRRSQCSASSSLVYSAWSLWRFQKVSTFGVKFVLFYVRREIFCIRLQNPLKMSGELKINDADYVAFRFWRTLLIWNLQNALL